MMVRVSMVRVMVMLGLEMFLRKCRIGKVLIMLKKVKYSMELWWLILLEMVLKIGCRIM